MFEIRKPFKCIFQSESPNICLVAARGSGKTVAACQWILERLFKSPPNSYNVFFSSTLVNVKGVVEPIMREILNSIPPKFWKYSKSEHKYTFFIDETDKRELYLLSYENPENKRGYHPYCIVLDECADMPEYMFGTIILPMGAKNILAIGTAKGHTKLYEFWKNGADPKFTDWESYTVKASTCNLYTFDYLDRMKRNLSTAEYSQEFECDFDANVLVGSVLGHVFEKFIDHNIDDSYDYDPSLPVYTAWDLGRRCYTCVWFFQVNNNLITFIDYYEGRNDMIIDHINEVLSKPYVIRKAFLPHDASHKRVDAPSTVAQIFGNAGMTYEIMPRITVEAGVQHTVNVLRVAKFNLRKCSKGLGKLRAVKYDVNFKTGVEKNSIHKDGVNDDCFDAMKYACCAITSGRIPKTRYQQNIVINKNVNEYNIFTGGFN